MPGAAKVHQYIARKKITIANPTENALTFGCVEARISIHTRLYSDPRCLQAYGYFNKQGNSSPINTVIKQQHICKRGKSPDGIKWFLDYLQDSIRTEKLKLEELTGPALEGLVGDLAMLKFDLKGYLMTNWLRSIGFPREVADRIVFALESFENARKYIKSYPEGPPAAVAWRSVKFGLYIVSAGQCCDSLEIIIYGKKLDPTLKVAARAGKGPDEVAQYSMVKEELDEIPKLFGKDHDTAVVEAQKAEQAKRKAEEMEKAAELKSLEATAVPAEESGGEASVVPSTLDTQAKTEADAKRIAELKQTRHD